MAAPSASVIIASLLSPTRFWSGSQITFSTPTAGSTWPDYPAGDEQDNAHYGVLTTAQAARFQAAAQAWDQIIAPSLVMTNDLSQPGQIRIAFTDVDAFSDDDDEDLAGYAYYPPFSGQDGPRWLGDIWLDYDTMGSAFAATSDDFHTMLHEMGHALGLTHPFENATVLPAEYDTAQYSAMSYELPESRVFLGLSLEGTTLRTAPSLVLPSTPMVFDILALQNRYGADPNTAAGPTTYGWSQSAPLMETIYDVGGIDTIDLSTHTRGSLIDLTPGAYSSIALYTAAQQASAWSTLYPSAASFIAEQFAKPGIYTWANNLGIAYGTVIENVRGGSGADRILGNDASNDLEGGGGDDYLRGFEGNDHVVGGAGFDDLHGNQGDDTVSGGLGPDWVVGGKENDLLQGEDDNDIVYGNLGDDWCDGGAGADQVRGGQDQDILFGQAGDDWLSGDRGADTISGGPGADIFHTFGDAGLDRVTDFNRAEGDRVMVDPGDTYSVSQSGADVIIALGGGQMVLAGVTLASLTGDWIFGA